MPPKNSKALKHWIDNEIPRGMADHASDKALDNWYAEELPSITVGQEDDSGSNIGTISLSGLLASEIIQ